MFCCACLVVLLFVVLFSNGLRCSSFHILFFFFVFVFLLFIFKRLSKFYNRKTGDGKALTEHVQQQVVTDVFQAVSRRGSGVCNFVEFPGTSGWGAGSKLVYRNFATLFFVCVADSSESELGVLELIHIVVEVLDKAFTEVDWKLMFFLFFFLLILSVGVRA